MSLLASVARAGPSRPAIQRQQWTSVILQDVQTRKYATPRNSGAGKPTRQGFRGQERDARGAIIPRKKDKNPGVFRPMPVNQLMHPIFESGRRDDLDLPIFHSNATKKSMIGRATMFPLNDNDPFRIFGLPKKMLLEFRILSKPCSVIRDVTVTTVEMLERAKAKSSLDTRVVLTGRSGCGKSFLLLQAVEYCIANDWIVVYIPRAVNLVNSTTTYAYDLRTQTYLQPVFAYQTLQKLLTVNSVALASLQTQDELILERKVVGTGTSLAELIGIGLKEQALAPIILDALMTELQQQTKHPVLLAVDDFQALYCRTAYRDPHFAAIRPYHLSMSRLIMDFACGNRSFAQGAILGAITYSDPIYPLPLELREALELPYDHPASPYDKRSRTLIEYTKGLRALPVPEKLSMEEAAALFEVWMKDKALVASAYDELFMSKYTESSGNPREFVWKGLLSTLEP